MITFFHNATALISIDDDGNPTGMQDVHAKITQCDAHFRKVGLGADFIKQFVR
ncbi:hypothetical protein [Acuticoccus sp.]|uniref:hypothetical protein n=1 Tax=Acuticoccus sp. TaxID=1904378 RepID=UPI003B5239D8